MAFRWRADNGPHWLAAGFFSGSGPVLLGNPINLWFFRMVLTPCTPPPSGSAHETYVVVLSLETINYVNSLSVNTVNKGTFCLWICALTNVRKYDLHRLSAIRNFSGFGSCQWISNFQFFDRLFPIIVNFSILYYENYFYGNHNVVKEGIISFSFSFFQLWTCPYERGSIK